MDFSVNATYWRPPGASATAGSPQAQVKGVSDGPTRDLHVRPPSRESYNLICGSTESFDAANNLLRVVGGDGHRHLGLCAPGS